MIDLTSYQSGIFDLCKRLAVKRLDLVGSAAREDFDKTHSDIDLLMEFEGTEHLFDRYFDLKFGLEKLFGRKVDLIQESALTNPYLIQSLKRNRINIYES